MGAAKILSNLRGTYQTLFQLGKAGPQWKNNAGVLEARNALDAAFVILRALTPAAANDVAVKSYVDGWLANNLQWANVATDQSLTNAGYTNLTTVGPSVSVTIGSSGLLLVYFGAQQYTTTSAGAFGNMTITLSGANTLAASDTNSVQTGSSASNFTSARGSRILLLSGLAAGLTTLGTQYKAGTGTYHWYNRDVLGLAL